MTAHTARAGPVSLSFPPPPWLLALAVVVIPGVLGGLSATKQLEGLAAAAFLLIAAVAAVSSSAGIAIVAFLAPVDAYVQPLVVYRDLLITDAIILAFMAGRVWMASALPRPPDARSGGFLLFLFLALHIVSLSPGNWSDGIDNVARLAFFAALVWTLAGCEVTPRVGSAAALALSVATLARMAQEAVPYFRGFIFDPSYQFGAMTSNPNTLGGFAAAVVPLTASVAASRASGRIRLSALILSAAMLGGIVLTFSKSAWVATAAGLVAAAVQFLLRGFRPRRAMVVGALLALVVAMSIPRIRAVPLTMVARWTSYGSELSNMERLRYIVVSGRLIVREPLLGVGLERYGPAFKHETGAQLGPEDPHNAYLMIATELGLPALGCFLLVVGTIAIGAWRRGQAADLASAPFRVGLSGSVVSLLVFQLFSAEPLASRVTWVLFGLALSAGVPARREVGP